MINQDKWLNSLNIVKENPNLINHRIWTNTIPKANTIPKKKKFNSIKKYSLIVTLFVCGLLFVSVIKNETRNLQKEINNLETSVDIIKFNLNQAILDNEVITSPENISLLAKKYLQSDLAPYEISQIKSLNDKNEIFFKVKKTKNKTVLRKKIKNIPTDIKEEVVQKIGQTKTEIRKLQELYVYLYNDPKSIPGEIKTQVAKKIKEKKVKLKNIYDSPKDKDTLKKYQGWAVVQIVKLFLGVPIMPGR